MRLRVNQSDMASAASGLGRRITKEDDFESSDDFSIVAVQGSGSVRSVHDLDEDANISRGTLVVASLMLFLIGFSYSIGESRRRRHQQQHRQHASSNTFFFFFFFFFLLLLVIPTARQYAESLDAPESFEGYVVGVTPLGAALLMPLYRLMLKKSYAGENAILPLSHFSILLKLKFTLHFTRLHAFSDRMHAVWKRVVFVGPGREQGGAADRWESARRFRRIVLPRLPVHC